MNTFLLVAAVMAAIAAGAVALPLLRDRQSRLAGVLLAVAVIGASAGLYPLWSNWNWHVPARSEAVAGPDVAAMVAKLEKRLQDQPNDLTGWLMLGRSYLTLDRLDDAVVAFDHAYQLDPKNADAAMGLGEAMSLRAGGDITPRAAQLFEEALGLAPGNPKALLYGGFAAAVRGDRALARTRWQALKDLHPPPQIVQMLDARIAELGPAAGSSAGAAGTADAAPAGTSASPAGTSASQGALNGADVTVSISIAPALKSRLVSEAPLFVFAREPGSQGPPLAAKRLTSSAIGSQIHLSPADSMLPGRVLAKGQQVSITARVSFSGRPMPAEGDLYGELSYDVGRDGVRNLVIDRVVAK
ncbi:MAG TPA: tetratricopeptide repeat protein [Steroidobacteraceae bacterium]|jgi:cytochrome c-type biogenesis protein CcmH